MSDAEVIDADFDEQSEDEEVEVEESEESTELAEVEVEQPEPEQVDTEVVGGEYRERVLTLKNRISHCYWELAETLKVIYDKALYQQWGHTSWNGYVEDELDFNIRKAQYLVRIVDKSSQLPEEAQSFLQEAGWTKAKELVNVVTPENWETWKARTEGRSVREIQNEIAGQKDEAEEPAEESAEASVQKERERFIRHTISLSEEQNEVFEQAVEHAKEAGRTDKLPRAVELIAISYVNTEIGPEDDATKAMIERLEKLTGLSLCAYDHEEGEWLHGYDFLEALANEEGETEEVMAELEEAGDEALTLEQREEHGV